MGHPTHGAPSRRRCAEYLEDDTAAPDTRSRAGFRHHLQPQRGRMAGLFDDPVLANTAWTAWPTLPTRW
jgi:hypothetical protein